MSERLLFRRNLVWDCTALRRISPAHWGGGDRCDGWRRRAPCSDGL